MKQTLLILAILITMCSLSCSSCKKETLNPNDLPPTTQTGANTLGFTLNGQSWTPQGNNGTANLSIDYDAGFYKGVFGISAYKIINSNNKEYFGIGIKDSLNFFTAPFSVSLSNTSLYRMRPLQDYLNQFKNKLCHNNLIVNILG